MIFHTITLFLFFPLIDFSLQQEQYSRINSKHFVKRDISEYYNDHEDLHNPKILQALQDSLDETHPVGSVSRSYGNPPRSSYLPPPKKSYLPPPDPTYGPPKAYLPPSDPVKTYLPPSDPSRTYLPPSDPSKTYLPPSDPSRTYLPPSDPSKTYLPPPSISKKYLPSSNPSKTYLPPSNPSNPPNTYVSPPISNYDPPLGKKSGKTYLPPPKPTYGLPFGDSSVTRHFFTHSGPDLEPENEIVTIDPPQKHYRFIFIKPPSLSGGSKVLRIVPPRHEEKTIVYVLSKQNNIDDLNIKYKNNEDPTNKPEVFFIKYKTPEEEQLAREQIIAQYDALEGSTKHFGENIAPVLSGPAGLSLSNNYLPSDVENLNLRF